MRTVAWPLLAVTLLAAGCTEDKGELRAWMDQVRRDTQPIRTTIPEPQQFAPFRYDAAEIADPFSSARMQVGLSEAAAKPGRGKAPDASRRREPLEAFPLDAIRMVGTIADGRQTVALLQVDSTLFHVRAGNYAGQNFGKIIGVTEQDVKIKELVQDTTGEWIEREAELRLHEARAEGAKK